MIVWMMEEVAGCMKREEMIVEGYVSLTIKRRSVLYNDVEFVVYQKIGLVGMMICIRNQ